jgi:hypothetical protein
MPATMPFPSGEAGMATFAKSIHRTAGTPLQCTSSREEPMKSYCGKSLESSIFPSRFWSYSM